MKPAFFNASFHTFSFSLMLFWPISRSLFSRSPCQLRNVLCSRSIELKLWRYNQNVKCNLLHCWWNIKMWVTTHAVRETAKGRQTVGKHDENNKTQETRCSAMNSDIRYKTILVCNNSSVEMDRGEINNYTNTQQA